MKLKFTLTSLALVIAGAASAQLQFDPHFNYDTVPETVLVPASPIKQQVLFIGGVDMVQTSAMYGNPAGQEVAKQWHDFIGFTPDTAAGTQDLGWISINHEMVLSDDKIGDGGGMTVFKVRRDPNTDSLIVVNQTLNDGRTGKFFNVDFVNHVGETGMNCGGINSLDGRIWSAEEWFRYDNPSIYDNGNGVRDTADYTIAGSGIAIADGQTVRKFENFNYMVEIDPRQAVAVRKQYNWGRQEFEGGVVMPDNKTVFLGADATPAFFGKFVADVAGDFTSGTLYAFKHDRANPWVEMRMNDMNDVVSYAQQAVDSNCTMFNRNEWVALDPVSGMVYFTETGRDNPGNAWAGEYADGCVFAPHHTARATAQGTTPENAAYKDFYGRVMAFNPVNNTMSVLIEGGPDLYNGAPLSSYPSRHLSNPDGLATIVIDQQTYLIIQEDLNGTSGGRVPDGVTNRDCEMYLLDLSIANPTWDDLIRVAQVPKGAEITGGRATPDGKTILFNSQHPSGSNPFPFNNSLTFAMTGWDQVSTSDLKKIQMDESVFSLYPNPTTRIVHFSQEVDFGLYNAEGNLVKVYRGAKELDVQGFAPGVYMIVTGTGVTKKLIVQ